MFGGGEKRLMLLHWDESQVQTVKILAQIAAGYGFRSLRPEDESQVAAIEWRTAVEHKISQERARSGGPEAKRGRIFGNHPHGFEQMDFQHLRPRELTRALVLPEQTARMRCSIHNITELSMC